MPADGTSPASVSADRLPPVANLYGRPLVVHKCALSEFWDRAHLLTTSSSQSPLTFVSACGENYGHSLAPPLPTKQALRGPLRRWYPSRWSGSCALPRAIRCCRQHRLCSHYNLLLSDCKYFGFSETLR